MLTKEKLYQLGLLVAVLIIAGLFFKSCQDKKALNAVKVEESNLRKALTDTLTHFQTKEGDWGAEKRTLQTELGVLKDNNLNLTENQKKLVKEVERQNKNGQTIAAAIVEMKAEIAGLKNDKPVLVTDTSAQFIPTEPNPYLDYDISVYNMKPLEFKTPTLNINKISFPNTQSVNFHWRDDKKEGYPVAFSVTNTNPYFKINDIQSYAIPEVKKSELKPNFWQKIDKFGKSTGGKIVIFGAGVIAGGILLN